MKRRKFGLVYVFVAILFLSSVMAGDRAVTVLSERKPMGYRCCIVIDAGHGGEDGGAVSCTGRPESGFNLQIALRLRDLLHLLGYETKMIRTEDVSVYTSGNTLAQKKVSDLKQRVRTVNEIQDAVLISIHQNTFPDSRYSGAQVFYAETSGSQEFARLTQDTLRAALNPASNRREKAASGIYLMDQIKCTGILVECGFLSNPEEEAKLRTVTFQLQLCCCIASSVSRFHSNA